MSHFLGQLTTTKQDHAVDPESWQVSFPTSRQLPSRMATTASSTGANPLARVDGANPSALFLARVRFRGIFSAMLVFA